MAVFPREPVADLIMCLFLLAGAVWRPHFKAVRCPQLATKMIEAGAAGVTCAKVPRSQSRHLFLSYHQILLLQPQSPVDWRSASRVQCSLHCRPAPLALFKSLSASDGAGWRGTL